MEAIGSNENINIIVQLNTPGYFNPTKRYIIKQGRRVLVQADGFVPNQKLNSGSPYTLIDCVDWAMKHYPAEHLYIVLWDHGTGPYDPGIAKTINTCDLFYMNPVNNLLELDRSLGYLDKIAEQSLQEETTKGICFDETFKSYMTNQDLQFALSEIHYNILQGKKIDCLAYDACLMSTIEIADICKEHVDYMIGSQEVEYGTGYDYELLLRPFRSQALQPAAFAQQAVTAFKQMYHNITSDYTHSAMKLQELDLLENNVNEVASLLIFAIENQLNKSVTSMLKKCKTHPYCTCFDEPSYIDLGHFYKNLHSHLHDIQLINQPDTIYIQNKLTDLLEKGVQTIKQIVIANESGHNLRKAHGISIYFPERVLFSSYPKCSFALSNNWSLFITKYLLHK
jgi:hypothetical protein